MTTRVGVIGVGNMGSALTRGWLRAGVSDLVVWDKSEQAVASLLATTHEPGGAAVSASSIRSVSSPEELAAAADTVVVVVKPNDAGGVMGSLSSAVGFGHTVVSAMAGLTLERLRQQLGPGPTLVRVMPNLAVELRAGAVAMAAEPGIAPTKLDDALQLFGLLGLVEVMPEDCFDAVTAVSGSSPAFFAVALEGLEDGAVAAGIGRAEARRMVRQAALETATQLVGSSGSPGDTRERMVPVERLGADILPHLEERGLRTAFRQAVTAAMERSRQMRKA